MSTPALVMQPSLPLAVRRVRGYFAPVDRLTATPAAFDATAVAAFDPDAPPAPWTDLGWIDGFARTSETKLQSVESGASGSNAATAVASKGAGVAVSRLTGAKYPRTLRTAGGRLGCITNAGVLIALPPPHSSQR